MGGNEDNTMIEDQSICEVMKITMIEDQSVCEVMKITQ